MKNFIKSKLFTILIAFRRLVSFNRNIVSVHLPLLHDIPPHELDRLKCLLDVLQENYIFITPHNFELFLHGKYELTKIHLLLTFDDGFYSNYLVAKDLLKSHDIKAIFFVSTGFIDLKNKIEVKRKSSFNKILIMGNTH